MRVGIGYDIHRLVAGRPLILGGVSIPSEVGLAGHSDGDAMLHAVTDAILGAIGGPDIGELFPSEDDRLIGADSKVFVDEALRRLNEAHMRIGNLDIVVIAQQPKMSPHKVAIKKRLAELLHIEEKRVNLKAKSTEGFPPENEGIAVHAVVLLK